MNQDLFYGLNGWYWYMPNGKIGVVVSSGRLLNSLFVNPDYKYREGTEVLFYMIKDEFRQLKMTARLKVDKTKQNELKEYHDKKYSKTPVEAPQVRKLG